MSHPCATYFKLMSSDFFLIAGGMKCSRWMLLITLSGRIKILHKHIQYCVKSISVRGICFSM